MSFLPNLVPNVVHTLADLHLNKQSLMYDMWVNKVTYLLPFPRAGERDALSLSLSGGWREERPWERYLFYGALAPVQKLRDRSYEQRLQF